MRSAVPHARINCFRFFLFFLRPLVPHINGGVTGGLQGDWLWRNTHKQRLSDASLEAVRAAMRHCTFRAYLFGPKGRFLRGVGELLFLVNLLQEEADAFIPLNACPRWQPSLASPRKSDYRREERDSGKVLGDSPKPFPSPYTQQPNQRKIQPKPKPKQKVTIFSVHYLPPLFH